MEQRKQMLIDLIREWTGNDDRNLGLDDLIFVLASSQGAREHLQALVADRRSEQTGGASS